MRMHNHLRTTRIWWHYAVWYNRIRLHKTLRVAPSIAADLSETIMGWAQIVESMDADMPPKKCSPYKTSEQIRNGLLS